MARIRHDVRSERLSPRLVQIEIPRHQLQQLALDIRHFILREHILVHHHFRRAQIRQEHRFLHLTAPFLPYRRQQKQQGAAHALLASRSSAHAVNVLLGVVWRVVLDDPVHCGDVQAARRDVGAEQHARLGVDELEEDGGAALLLLLAVDAHDGDVDVVQQLRVELHRVAAREEHPAIQRFAPSLT